MISAVNWRMSLLPLFYLLDFLELCSFVYRFVSFIHSLCTWFFFFFAPHFYVQWSFLFSTKKKVDQRRRNSLHDLYTMFGWMEFRKDGKHMKENRGWWEWRNQLLMIIPVRTTSLQWRDQAMPKLRTIMRKPFNAFNNVFDGYNSICTYRWEHNESPITR